MAVMILRLLLVVLCSIFHCGFTQKDITKEIVSDISNFWLKYGPDEEFGGFHGTLDSKGQPTSPTDKTIVQQSRHLFATSFLFYNLNNGLQLNKNGAFSIDQLEGQMEQLFQFLINNFVRDDQAEFPYKVSRDGKRVVDGDVRMYYTSFGIFGLSWYAKATNNNNHRNLAIQTALQAFRSMDGRLHDKEFLGYDQTREGNWFQFVASRYKFSNSGAAKGYNSHMHLLEALIPLYEVSQDSTVGSRLAEMIQVFMEYIIGDKNYCATALTKQWVPISGNNVEYGHDLEAMAILLQAVNVVQNQYSREEVVSKVLPVIRHAIQYGFDVKTGGFFYSGKANQNVEDFTKVWWVQTEACLALYRIYQLTGDQQHLQQLLSTLNFIKQKQQSDFGELYEEVGSNGNVIGNRNLGHEWKTSYHNMRALISLLQT
eukprot:TRINITY_DN5067_c0_g2_i2.p1 TRINITY_DN5067_c0_g2~~TRINITY_DN5067_c0_g2_i2.p1  ORF type:complete len:428 (+),score=47.29 TRINITY_DN5067_c0_g2_i2:133-1416(+)